MTGSVTGMIVLVAAVIAGCTDGSSGNHRSVGTFAADSVALDTVARGLEVPWAIAFTPDGRILVTERVGRIRVIEGDSLRGEPWATLDVMDDGEAGLMGIAIAPDFAESHHVFVVGTFASGVSMVNRVVQLTERDGLGVDPKVIVDGIPAHPLHSGDAIAFGPDGMLFVATGDAREPGRADDMTSLAGKILRYMPDGSIPQDNPTPGSPVFAKGFRNVQGLAWSARGQLFATDHGPSGFANELFRRDNDELNAVRAGGDYGWPMSVGEGYVSRSIDPITAWSPAIAPSGLAVYTGRDFPQWTGNLFVGALRGTQLRRVAVSPRGDRWQASEQEPVIENLGRVRAVAMGPDGHLYITTSNRDGRATTHPGDDHVFRLKRKR